MVYISYIISWVLIRYFTCLPFVVAKLQFCPCIKLYLQKAPKVSKNYAKDPRTVQLLLLLLYLLKISRATPYSINYIYDPILYLITLRPLVFNYFGLWWLVNLWIVLFDFVTLRISLSLCFFGCAHLSWIVEC